MTSLNSATDVSGQFRVVVNSIGTAKPATSAAIAKGLGISASTVVSRLYRAPAILVEGVEQEVAQQVTDLLCDIGYQAEVQGIDQPAPHRSPLHDVAVYVDEADAFLPTVKAISRFAGMSEADASNMLMTPPGIVLGSVSQATVDAFSAQLGEGVSLTTSVTEEAVYDIFMGAAPDIVSRRILSDIREAGLTTVAENGLIATDVDHETAQALWRRHQASGAMRVVNRDFLRFDLICTGVEPGFNKASEEQVALLGSLVGIPEEMVPEVLDSLPLTLLEAVPNGKVEEKLSALTEVGLQMRADLISFQMLGLEVVSVSQPAATSTVLEGYGLLKAGQGLPRTPFKLDGVMPELQAKLIKAALHNSGAEVEYVESE